MIVKFGTIKRQILTSLVDQSINFLWDNRFSNIDANQKTHLFNQAIKTILCNFIPHETVTCDDRDLPWINSKIKAILNGIKVWVFFEKNIKKKHLCRHDKNYYYFCKSNIPVTNLTAGSRNMIKVSENMSFEKVR